MTSTTVITVSVAVPLVACLLIGIGTKWRDLPEELLLNSVLSVMFTEAMLAWLYGAQAHVDGWLVGHVSTTRQIYASTVLACLLGALFLLLLTVLDITTTTGPESEVELDAE